MRPGKPNLANGKSLESPRGRLGAAAPLREGRAPSERLALRTPFLRFRSGQFRTSLTLSPIYTASCRRACFSPDTASWSVATAMATLRQDPTLVARFLPAPSLSNGIWSASDLTAVGVAASFSPVSFGRDVVD